MSHRHFRLLALLSLLFSLLGCVSALPERPVGSGGVLPAEKVFRKSYELGRRQTAFVGQPLAAVKDYTIRRVHGPHMTPTISCLVKAGLDKYRIEPGQPYPVRGVVTVDGREYSVVELMVARGIVTLSSNALVDESGAPHQKLAIRKGDKTYLMKPLAKFDPPDLRFEYSKDDTIVDQKAGFTNFELIYTGTDGRSFSIAYREYTPDDLAKPAFSQALVYPAGSESIRFKSLQIAVHEASSEKLSYTVLADDLQ